MLKMDFPFEKSYPALNVTSQQQCVLGKKMDRGEQNKTKNKQQSMQYHNGMRRQTRHLHSYDGSYSILSCIITMLKHDCMCFVVQLSLLPYELRARVLVRKIPLSLNHRRVQIQWTQEIRMCRAYNQEYNNESLCFRRYRLEYLPKNVNEQEVYLRLKHK